MPFVPSALLIAACTPPAPDGAAPEPASGVPTLVGTGSFAVSRATVEPPPPGAYLSAVYTVTSDVPTALSLAIDGPNHRVVTWPELAREHRVPVLGLRAGYTYDLVGTLTDDQGRTVDADAVSWLAGVEPGPLPGIEALEPGDPARLEPGYTLMPMSRGRDDGFVIALDREGHVVFGIGVGPSVSAVSLTGDGHLAMLDGNTLRIADVFGTTLRRWTNTPSDPVTDVFVPYGDFHHEIQWQPDGSVFALTYAHAHVGEYPLAYDPPDMYGPAVIRNDIAVHLADDGTILGAWAMLGLVDPHHIGFDSLSFAPSGALDWVHANALQYDADTNEITLSLRHQDTVIHFSAATGELLWMFGSPGGWASPWSDLLLTQTEPFTWQTHQHAIQLDSDGTLRMLDNGNDLRSTPYASSGETTPYSRLLEVHIDPVAGTVTPSASFIETSTGSVYARSRGNADLLPRTGNRLGVFVEPGRLVEWSSDGEVLWELQIDEGWTFDRAIRVPSLYGAGVVELLDPE